MLRPFLLGAGLALCGFVATASVPYVLPKPVSAPAPFAVSNVVIQGADRARSVEVRHLADLHRGTAIWSVAPRAVAAAVERHPWVRSAEVDVTWPNRVDIRVEERKIAGVLLDQERWLYVDDHGVAFLRAEELDYPVLTDMGRSLDRIHPQLGRLVRRQAVTILEALEQQEVVASADVSEVAFAGNVGFVVQTHGARLLFGIDRLERQVERLDQILAMGVDLGQRLTIDLAPESVALIRPTKGRYPRVANHFRQRDASTVATAYDWMETRRLPR